jgi:hypothetical protein
MSWREGDRQALNRLMSFVYHELRSLARRYWAEMMRRILVDHARCHHYYDC